MTLRRILLLPAALACLAGAAVTAQERVFSGPQPGEKLTPFKVFIATGERKGQETDLIAEFAGAPTMLVFVHELTRPGAALMRALDAFQQRRAADGLKLAFIFLPRDRTELEQRLPLVANSLRFPTPLTISVDGAEGPGNYGLNRNVQVTALVAKGNTVTASFALVQPNETDAPKVLAEVVKLIGGTVPPLSELGPARARMARPTASPGAGGARDGQRPPAAGERPSGEAAPATAEEVAVLRREVRALRAQYADLVAVVNELRRQMAQMKGEPAPAPLLVPPPDGAPPREGTRAARLEAPATDAGLQSLFRQLIRRDQPTERIDRLAKEVAEYVGADRALKKQASDLITLALTRNYGSPHAQQAMRGLQTKWR